MNNNYIFYHCTPISDFKERFYRTFKKIETSTLLDKINKLFIFVNGNTNFNFKLNNKIELITTSQHPNESKTINKLQDFCKSNLESNVLYLHAKGLTKVGKELPNVNAWVNLMEYFLIEKYHTCLLDLHTYDIVGTLLRESPKLHFSGNFWWARSDYVASLDTCYDDYYAPEMWHLSKTNKNRLKCYFNTSKNLYMEEIKKEEYAL